MLAADVWLNAPMPQTVTWTELAMEDLRAVGDSIEAAEIFHIARTELQPGAASEIEGPLQGEPHVRFRRCVRMRDLADFTSFEINEDSDAFTRQACDYVLLYRALTADELINLRRKPGTLVILKVVSNTELAPLIADAYSR